MRKDFIGSRHKICLVLFKIFSVISFPNWLGIIPALEFLLLCHVPFSCNSVIFLASKISFPCQFCIKLCNNFYWPCLGISLSIHCWIHFVFCNNNIHCKKQKRQK